MSPKEFNWQADDQVTVINPTKEKFQFKVYSKLYEVAAGQKAKMPGYIAWMYCYTMAQKLIHDEGQFSHWNDEGFRNKYYDQLVEGTENTIQAIPSEPEPIAETFDGEIVENEDTAKSTGSSTDNDSPIKPMRKVAKATK